MPCFFFDTYNSFVHLDDVGQDLPDLADVRREVRRTLPALLADGIFEKDKAQFRIEVRDERGQRVVTATVLMVIDRVDDLR